MTGVVVRGGGRGGRGEGVGGGAEKLGFAFFETSAKDGAAVDEAFLTLARMVKRRLDEHPSPRRPVVALVRGARRAGGRERDGERERRGGRESEKGRGRERERRGESEGEGERERERRGEIEREKGRRRRERSEWQWAGKGTRPRLISDDSAKSVMTRSRQ